MFMRKTLFILATLLLSVGISSVKGSERKANDIPGPTETSYSNVVNQKTQSNEAFILSFGFIEDPGAQVDIYDNYISVTVAWDTDITSLTPTMTISESATVDYTFPTTMDFSESVYFTVTAEDGVTTNTYMVWVFQEYQNPEITPEVQFFGLADPDEIGRAHV